jgi:E1A/CREB-binding protein
MDDEVTSAAYILLSINQTTKIYTEDEKKVIKKQQYRLLLLRHAGSCKYNNCMVFNCKLGKEIWEHIMICKNIECTTPHCVSSRYVLSHYGKCENKKECVVCCKVYYKKK